MTTDPNPLQERIARVLHEIDPVTGHGHDWGKLSSVERKFYRHKAAAVLPILRAAQADAWDEGYHEATGGDGDPFANPHRYETED